LNLQQFHFKISNADQTIQIFQLMTLFLAQHPK